MDSKQLSSIEVGLTPDLLLDQIQVAKLLGVTTKFLEARRCRGGGPDFVKIGSLVRYHPDALRRWISSRTMKSTSEDNK